MFSNRDPKKNNKRKYLQCFYNLCRDVSLRKKEKKRNKKCRYLSNPWNSNIYQYPSHDPLVKTCIHKYLCERRRSISKQSFFNRIFPIEGRNRILARSHRVQNTPRFSRSTVASWLLKRNRPLYGQYIISFCIPYRFSNICSADATVSPW